MVIWISVMFDQFLISSQNRVSPCMGRSASSAVMLWLSSKTQHVTDWIIYHNNGFNWWNMRFVLPSGPFFNAPPSWNSKFFFRVVGIKIILLIKLQQSNLLVRISQFSFAFLELKKKFESHNYNENPCTAIQTSSCTIICMLSTMKQRDGQFVYIMWK